MDEMQADFVISLDRRGLHGARREIGAFFRAASLSKDDCRTIRRGLFSAIKSAVLHARRYRRSEIQMRLDVRDGSFTGIVADRGLRSDERGSRREIGDAVMRSLSSEFVRHTGSRGTTVSMVFAVRASNLGFEPVFA